MTKATAALDCFRRSAPERQILLSPRAAGHYDRHSTRPLYDVCRRGRRMDAIRDSDQQPGQPSELDLVVAEVVSEAHLEAAALRPEERDYLKKHALKKPMGVLHIWA